LQDLARSCRMTLSYKILVKKSKSCKYSCSLYYKILKSWEYNKSCDYMFLQDIISCSIKLFLVIIFCKISLKILQDLYLAGSCDLAKLFMQDFISCVNRAYLGRNSCKILYLAQLNHILAIISCKICVKIFQDLCCEKYVILRY
jgi:hypothetical protein